MNGDTYGHMYGGQEYGFGDIDDANLVDYDEGDGDGDPENELDLGSEEESDDE